MRLKEVIPKNSVVGKFVDRYQYFDIPQQSFLKTLPNGKLDIYIIIDGGFGIFDSEKNKFISVPETGILPATNRDSLLKISSNFRCINIKFNLNILSINGVSKLYDSKKLVSAEGLFSKCFVEIIQRASFLRNDKIAVALLDDHLSTEFNLDCIEEDDVSKRVIDCMQTTDDFSVEKIAQRMNVSPRTLVRITKRNFGFSPIELWNVLRFDRTTAHLKKNNVQKFIEALDFGYYDQSHFIKECRKYTGTIPKEVFSRMSLSTNDLMIYKNLKGQKG